VKRKGPTAQPAEFKRVGTEIGEIGAKACKSDDDVRGMMITDSLKFASFV
jgi:hypothetical protein